MLIILNNLFFLLSFSFAADSTKAPSPIYKNGCSPRTYQILEGGSSKTEKSEMCLDFQSGKILSQNCRTQNCEVSIALRKAETVTFPKWRGELRGNPLFQVCEELGGIPQLLKFEKNQNTYNRCLFAKDHSYVDLGQIQAKLTKSK